MSSNNQPPRRSCPYIPLFCDAYLAGTQHLKLEEHGAHILLLNHAWLRRDCALPNDDDRLSRILGVTSRKWLKLKPAVMALWNLEGALWTQKRLTRERVWVEAKRMKSSAAANKRWNPDK